jgi:hypothetical protein
MKWSSTGGTVNLIDQDLKQLTQSSAYIDELAANTKFGGERGKVNMFASIDLSEAVKDAWLIMEVREISPSIFNALAWLMLLVRTRKFGSEEDRYHAT